MNKEPIFIPVPGDAEGAKLHLMRMCSDPDGPPVLLLHGAIENGRIFYSASGKGYAPYLAERGFDVYVADLRGRGLSVPHVSRASRFGQTESIVEDLALFSDAIRERRGDIPQFWVAHSWGGVLMLSHLARFPERAVRVAGMIFFGTKRSLHVQNWEKALKIDFFWNFFARAVCQVYGYLPAKRFGWGSDDESDLSHLHSKLWVKPGPWIDPKDGFDYGAAIRKVKLPPKLFLAGSLDQCLGNPQDVRELMAEVGEGETEYWLLKGYGHVDMLTSPRAVEEHFPMTVGWLRDG